MTPTRSLPLQPKDFASAAEPRWCPGCGDFSILAQLKKVLAGLNLPPEQMVFVSGAGCAARLPHYLRTFGFQTLPGRAIPVALGLKQVRPELQVWVVGGEGDLLQRGANYLLDAIHQNADIKILLINNEILGQSRGQASPTSRLGIRTPTTPSGVCHVPLRPAVLALSADCRFVARTLDVDIDHLAATLERAARYRGTAFVEIYQNCNIYNPDAFAYASAQSVRPDTVVYLEHGQALIFGKDRDRTIAWRNLRPEVVPLASIPPEQRWLHDETLDDPTWALTLALWSYCETPEALPEVLGVLRAVPLPSPQESSTQVHRVATLASVLAQRWQHGAIEVPLCGTTAKQWENPHALPLLRS
ncbi:MAG: thiamine pyrophosphate-dependent enzyme [Gemmataceae bacterium]